MLPLPHIKTAAVAELVKPVPCNKCGEAIFLAPYAPTFAFSKKILSYSPVNVVMSEAEPEKAIPLYHERHYDTCVIALLERKRELAITSTSHQATATSESVLVIAKIANGSDCKTVKAREATAELAGQRVRDMIAENFDGYEIVSWSVS